jgi:4-amino-4-deoxy-L-arabinose transferase-like glycosyltransferase
MRPRHVLILTVAWILFLLIVQPAGNFPLNDDWQYAYPVMKLIEEGRLMMQGVFAPNIILQVGWGSLFCWLGGSFDYTWLRYSTLALAFASSILFYLMADQLGVGARRALLGSLVLSTMPLFFNLSFSFMTDVPFLCLSLSAAFAFMRYLHMPKWKNLVGVLLLSTAAFLIRQPGILFLPVAGLWMIWEKRGNRFSCFFALGCMLLSVLIYFTYRDGVRPWLGIADNFFPVSSLFFEEFIHRPFNFLATLFKRGVKTWIYLGFFSLPLLPFLWLRILPLLRKQRMLIVLLAVNLGGFLLLVYVDKIFPFGGNVLYNWGLGPELLSDVYTLQINNTPQLPTFVMYLLHLIAQGSATLLCWAIFENWSTYTTLQKQYFRFLILFNLAYVPLMSIFSFFDRFLLFSIASFFLLLLPLLQNSRAAGRYIPLLVFAAFSLLATRDYLAWNRAKAQAFGWLVAADIPFSKMDAGFEYNGLYNYQEEKTTDGQKSYWWVEDDEWMISFGPVPGYETRHTVPYRRWLWGGQQDAIRVIQRVSR